MTTTLPTCNRLVSKFNFTGICVVLFVLFLGPVSTIAQSTDSGYQMGYRFSIDGITNPPQAEQAISIISDQSFISGVKFIDECDCFKIIVHQPINYDDLSGPLLTKQFDLSDVLHGEDGSILKKDGLTNEIKD